MTFAAFIIGLLCIITVLWDAFEYFRSQHDDQSWLP
jgi:hypothetical protein